MALFGGPSGMSRRRLAFYIGLAYVAGFGTSVVAFVTLLSWGSAHRGTLVYRESASLARGPGWEVEAEKAIRQTPASSYCLQYPRDTRV